MQCTQSNCGEHINTEMGMCLLLKAAGGEEIKDCTSVDLTLNLLEIPSSSLSWEAKSRLSQVAPVVLAVLQWLWQRV